VRIVCKRKTLTLAIKHLVVERELGIEYLARVARQIEGPKDDDLILKMNAIAKNVKDVERLIEEIMGYIFVESEEADASTFRFEPEQFRRFLMQLGHLVCCEEHFTDHLTSATQKLLEEKEEEKKERREEANQLALFLDATRLIRQEYINSMITEIGEVVAQLPE